ncbi:DNA gyrase inhibitor YacG [Propionivibrio sp.]|uniref:DNA gyrase inhibitor YacG n=1 Tax=Propionivibrio sp. TaxID=2212460 RepID=UPI003BF0922D
MPKPLAKVRCPQCGGESEWNAANKFRPFCCERCKLIDLGAWASESYRVPVQETKDPLSELPTEE